MSLAKHALSQVEGDAKKYLEIRISKTVEIRTRHLICTFPSLCPLERSGNSTGKHFLRDCVFYRGGLPKLVRASSSKELSMKALAGGTLVTLLIEAMSCSPFWMTFSSTYGSSTVLSASS